MPISNIPTSSAVSGKFNIQYYYSIENKKSKVKSDTQKTSGLTPDEINELFLDINATIKEHSLQDKYIKLSFSFVLKGHFVREEEDVTDIIIVDEQFSNLTSMEQFLKENTGLVMPSDEILDVNTEAVDYSYDLYSVQSDENESYFASEVDYTEPMTYGYDNKQEKGDADEETIDRVYKKILGMTQKYHADSRKNRENELSNKDKLFNKLEAVLTNSNQTKYQRLQGFATMLKNEDKNILNQHRTAAWIRYVADALSFLTLLPAVARAAHSYAQYGTVQFWKPASERLKTTALEECKTLNILCP